MRQACLTQCQFHGEVQVLAISKGAIETDDARMSFTGKCLLLGEHLRNHRKEAPQQDISEWRPD